MSATDHWPLTPTDHAHSHDTNSNVTSEQRALLLALADTLPAPDAGSSIDGYTRQARHSRGESEETRARAANGGDGSSSNNGPG